MATRLACAAALAALLAGPATLAALQAAAADTAPANRVGLTVTVHAGGVAFTRFQNVTLEAPGSEQGSYPSSIAASTAASLGADLTLWFRPWLGARVDLLYAPSNFEMRLSEADRADVLGDEADYHGLDYSDISLFAVSVTGVLTLPVRSRHLAPYVLMGLGGSLWSADDRGASGLDEAFDGHGSAYGFGAIAGLGVKIPLRGTRAGRVALSFELTDRITRSPVPANDDRVLLDTEEIRVIGRLHEQDLESDAKYVHGVGIAAGLSFSTGGPTPAEQPAQ